MDLFLIFFQAFSNNYLSNNLYGNTDALVIAKDANKIMSDDNESEMDGNYITASIESNFNHKTITKFNDTDITSTTTTNNKISNSIKGDNGRRDVASQTYSTGDILSAVTIDDD